MNKQEVSLLLAALAEYQYIEPSEVGVQMWSASLDDEIPAQFAINYVARWYSIQDAPKMLPGNINKAWKDEKTKVREINAVQSYRSIEKTSMPAWFKAAMIDAFGSTELGRRPKTGVDVQKIFDDALAIAEEDKWKPYAS